MAQAPGRRRGAAGLRPADAQGSSHPRSLRASDRDSARRAHLVAILAVVAVVAVASAYDLETSLTTNVIVSAGTVVTGKAILYWVAHFDAPSGGHVVGAAEANLTLAMSQQPGWWGIALAPETILYPPIVPCPATTRLPVASQSFNVSILPGTYTFYWAICMTYLPISITVSQNIELVP